jgi:hypothetical protein
MKSLRFISLSIFLVISVALISGCSPGPEGIASPTPTEVPIQETPSSTQEVPISTWSQVYSKGKENSGSELVFTNDGGMLIVGGIGHFRDNEPIGGVMLLRTDERGEPLWQRVFGGDGYDYGSAIIESHEGGYLIAGATRSFGSGGSDGYVIGVNEFGEESWSKTYGGALNELFNTILPIPGEGFYLVGNVEDPKDFITDPGVAGYGGLAGRSNVYIVRLDQKGNQDWEKVIESELNIISTDALLSIDGNILVLATVIKFPTPDNNLLLYSFDESGDPMWIKTWEDGDMSGYAMDQDRAGNLLITGIVEGESDSTTDAFLLKLDPEGNELWLTQFGTPNQYEIGRDVVVMENGNYAVLAQQTPSFFVSDISNSIRIFDSDGDLLWESEIELDEFEYSLKSGALFNHPEGGFIIVGAGTGTSGEFITMLIRTDADGSIN